MNFGSASKHGKTNEETSGVFNFQEVAKIGKNKLDNKQSFREEAFLP